MSNLTMINENSLMEVLEEMKVMRSRLDALEKANRIDPEVKDTTKASSSKVIMPWIGLVNDNNCRGLRINHGLYTQCDNKKTQESNGMWFCKTCYNQGVKNGSGIPNSGTVDERLKYDIMGYVDKKTGKKCIPWCQVLNKLNIDIDEAKQEAEKQNITIPECHFVSSEKKRGRPKKNNNTSVSDTDSETTEGGVGDESPKKKRGRPKKDKKATDVVAGDDLIAKMISNLAPSQEKSEEVTSTEKEEKNSDDELEEEDVDDDDEPPTEVQKITINGKDYLIDMEDTIYDINSTDDPIELGKYDKENDCIIEN